MDQMKNRFVKLLQRIASFLNSKVNALHPFQQKALLLTLGITAAMTCLNLIVHPFVKKNSFSITIDSIQQPASIHPEDSTSEAVISIEGLLETVSLLDSLKQTPFGKVWYDSILQTHPGLEDSLTNFLKSIQQ